MVIKRMRNEMFSSHKFSHGRINAPRRGTIFLNAKNVS